MQKQARDNRFSSLERNTDIEKCRNAKIQKYRSTKSLGKEVHRCGSTIGTMGSVAWRELYNYRNAKVQHLKIEI